MKIAVICANGRTGSLVAREAVSRGHDVTAVVRHANRSAAPKAVIKDIMALTREDLAGFDVVVDCFGIWVPEQMDQHTTTLMHLCDILAGSRVRLLVVGGAASLFTDPDHTRTVRQTPDFPAAYRPVADAMMAGLAKLRARKDVLWTYVSPALAFNADGERTGVYTLGGEELTLNAAGESSVSYADYAIAMVDLAEAGSYVCERVSVVSR